MRRIVCMIMILMLGIGLFSACAGKETSDISNDNPGTSENIADTTVESVHPDRTINGVIKSFSASTLDGKPFNFSDIEAYDVTVINFWGTYCGPCIREMPDLGSFAESLPENVQFITFCIDATDGNTEKAQSIIDNAGMTATVITSADGDFIDVLRQIQYIPTTLFVSKTGEIVGSEIIGGVQNVSETYNSHIAEALAEIAGK